MTLEPLDDSELARPISPFKNVSLNNNWRCLVLSLVRHGQATSNVQGWRAGEDSPLTALGCTQVEALGEAWSKVRITKLVSSQLQRALATAKEISIHNVSHPLVSIDSTIAEQRSGSLVPKLYIEGRTQEGALALGRVLLNGVVPRSHTPPDGGESLDTVAQRAKTFILSIVEEHAVETGHGPEEFDLEMWKGNDATRIPPGLPHVVAVSHNVFLGELYELLHHWNSTEERTTGFNRFWRNANWTRHVLWIRDGKDSSYELIFRDLVPPIKKEGTLITIV